MSGSSDRTVRPTGGTFAEGRRLAPWQPWAVLGLFAFLLHFTWEMLQVPFFRGMEDAAHWRATVTCLRTAGGDVVITLLAYAAVTWRTDRGWLLGQSPGPRFAFVGSALGIATVLELLSVHVWERWTYAPEMPVLLGVGLAPLLQWLLLPPLILWLARRHIGA